MTAPPAPPAPPPRTSQLERFGTTVDEIRLWLSKAWRIGVMMAKGAYLLGERRRLFTKLGEEAYKRLVDGQWKDPALDQMVHQLDRLTKKVKIEEMLIQNARFGKGSGRLARDGEEPAAHDGPPAPSAKDGAREGSTSEDDRPSK